MSLIEIPKNVDSLSIEKLQGLVSQVRAHLQNQNRRKVHHVELEIRLGNKNDSKYISDIGHSSFMRIVGAADASHVWDKIVPVQEIVDFFYKTEDGRAVRTSRFLDESTGEINSVHVHKERQGMCMLDIYGCSSITNTIRVAFNTETEIPLDELPDITSTDNVRIKHRRSYIWGMWRFDMTTVWSASTYAIAMKYRDDPANAHAKYELEIELVDVPQYFERKFHTDEYITVSMLMKVLGLLPRHISIQ